MTFAPVLDRSRRPYFVCVSGTGRQFNDLFFRRRHVAVEDATSINKLCGARYPPPLIIDNANIVDVKFMFLANVGLPGQA
jgi:hypothetical protein